MKQLPSYYGILPPSVRYNRRLSANAKLLWCELSALQSHVQRVYASNNYLSELVGVNERQIRNLLSELKKEKLITIERKGTNRVITLNNIVLALKPSKSKKRNKDINEPEWLNDYVTNFESTVIDL